MSGYRGRFAPSPTGPLHLGLARTALIAWLRARAEGGKLVLRSEDIDGPRVVPTALASILDELRFLGLDWDEGPDVGGPHSPYEQSRRLARYHAAIEQLGARVYPCKCTRKELAIASAPHGEFGPVYPGTCRPHPPAGGPHALRFAVDELGNFQDGLLGEVAPSARGDFVVRRADGTISYQLAVVVDDIEMGITEVVRGEDLAGCTGWQLSLYRALGAAPPAFVHLPLLMGQDGRRLAKRDRALSVAELRARGVPSQRIVGALAASVGLVQDGAQVAPSELVAGFSLSQLRARPLAWSALSA